MAKPDMHPDMAHLIAARDAAGPKGETPEEQRAFWTAYTGSLNESHPADMEVWDETVPTPDGGVPVRLYRPAGAPQPAPAVLYMHGGGFMLGDLDSSDAIAWGFAQQARALVISVDYRLTPDHPYPAAVNDCWNTLLWMQGHAERLGLDPARMGVAGDSAGGNLGAVMALKARDTGALGLRCAAIVYPGTGLDQDQASYLEHADGPGLTRAGTIKYRELYIPSQRDQDDPYARPILADLSNLPPFWVHSAEIDPIRDDGRAFAAKLAMAGNHVTYREARGMIHGFMRARFKGADARHEYDLICRFLADHLHGEHA
jgi:acetyl esterase